MRKLIFAVAALMLMTLNLFADASNFEFDATVMPSTATEGTLIGTLTGDISDEILNYANFGLKGSTTQDNEMVEVDSETGAVTLAAGVTLPAIGETVTFEFRIRERVIDGNDPVGDSVNGEFTLTVLDPNAVYPTFGGSTLFIAYDDIVIGAFVGQVSATSDTVVTYAQTDGDTEFTIDEITGIITADDNSIAEDTYYFEVTATDADGDFTVLEFTIEVEEAPIIPLIVTASASLPETAAVSFDVVEIYTAGGTGALTYTEVSPTSDAFSVTPSGTIVLDDPSLLDFEEVSGSKTFNFNVQVEDSAMTPEVVTKTIVITVTNVNEVSLDPAQDRSIGINAPNTTPVGNPLTYSTDNQATTEFSILGGTPFTIDNDGQIRVNDEGNLFGASYGFTVTITDTVSNQTDTQNVTVTITPAPDLIIDQDTVEIDEDGPFAAVPGAPRNTGINVGIQVGSVDSYAIEANSNFDIDIATGELIIKTGILLDYETTTEYTYDVTVVSGFDSDTAAVTIKVGDLQDNGTVALVDQTRSIDENSSALTNVGLPLAFGVDYALNMEMTTTSVNFGITNAGQIYVQPAANLDFELQESYIISVTITDSVSAATDTANITINVNDIPETGKPLVNDQSFSIEEGSYAINDGLDLFVASDGDNLIFSFAPMTNVPFGIDAATGELEVVDPSEIKSGAIFVFDVRTTNTVTNEYDEGTITLNVVKVDTLGRSKKSGNELRRLERASKCTIADSKSSFASFGAFLAALALMTFMSKKTSKA